MKGISREELLAQVDLQNQRIASLVAENQRLSAESARLKESNRMLAERIPRPDHGRPLA